MNFSQNADTERDEASAVDESDARKPARSEAQASTGGAGQAVAAEGDAEQAATAEAQAAKGEAEQEAVAEVQAVESESPAKGNALPEDDDTWWHSDAEPASNSASEAPQTEAAQLEAATSATNDLVTLPENSGEVALEVARQRAVGEAEEADEDDETDEPEQPVAFSEPEEGTRVLDAASAPAISAQRSVQGLAAMALRDIGRIRSANQDSVYMLLTTLPREGSDMPVGLFIVADGMGGHDGGEIASRMAVRVVAEQVLAQLVLPALEGGTTEALQTLMVGAVQEANRAIWEHAQTIGSDMGTTCTAALLVGQGLYIAHVGDSRAYLLEPGGLKQLTSDHSTVGRLIQLGQLEPSEAREHPLRNQLYRTVGQQPQLYVDLVYQTIGNGSHLLLCSDGLWGMVEEPWMEQALMHSPWPQDICNELIALANLAGGEDNISAVVVALPTS